MIRKYKFTFYSSSVQEFSYYAYWYCKSRVTHSAVRDLVKKIMGVDWDKGASVVISVSAVPRKGYTKGPGLKYDDHELGPAFSTFRLKNHKPLICAREAKKIGLKLNNKIQYLYYQVGKVRGSQ